MGDIFQAKPSSLEISEKGLKRLENQIYEECNAVILSVVKDTFEIDPEDKELPAAWLADVEAGVLTLEEAQKRKRIAQYALMSPKNAPVALQIAAKVLSGMHKARSAEGNVHRSLNVTVVQMTAPMPVFEEKEIDHE